MKLIFKQKINLKSTLKIKSKCFYCLNMFILSEIVVETWNWTFLKSFFLSNHSHKSYNNGEDTLNFQDSYFYFKSCLGSIFNHEQTKSDDYENLGVEICFIFLLATPIRTRMRRGFLLLGCILPRLKSLTLPHPPVTFFIFFKKFSS
jgi:hypothetical protein